MVNKDFFIALDLLEKERNIKKEDFIALLETALTSAYKKNFGEAKSAFVKLFPERNTIKVYSYKTVVEEVEDFDKQISLADAKQIKKTSKVGDQIMEEVTPRDFGRIAAQTARQVIMQKIREAEKNTVLQGLESKAGDIITGIVRRMDDRAVYLEIGLDQAEGVLANKDQIPGEKFQIGDKVRVYAESARDDFRGATLNVSRTSPNFIRKLFEYEVPEIENGLVVIKNIAREPGLRTKISVYATDPNLDAIGACVGNRGARVNAVLAELGNEKIDIVPYSDIPEEYIAAALSPVRIVTIDFNTATKQARVRVMPDKLSLAIGKQGHNVRLAAKLTGFKIDVKAYDENENQETVQKPTQNISVDETIDDNDAFADLDL